MGAPGANLLYLVVMIAAVVVVAGALFLLSTKR